MPNSLVSDSNFQSEFFRCCFRDDSRAILIVSKLQLKQRSSRNMVHNKTSHIPIRMIEFANIYIKKTADMPLLAAGVWCFVSFIHFAKTQWKIPN
jgi:hypothetical protein